MFNLINNSDTRRANWGRRAKKRADMSIFPTFSVRLLFSALFPYSSRLSPLSEQTVLLKNANLGVTWKILKGGVHKIVLTSSIIKKRTLYD